MATDYTQRLDEETQKANAARASALGIGSQLAARGITRPPGAQPTASTPSPSAGPSSGLSAPWYSPEYARAANASEKSGLELERDRRTAGVSANLPKNDFVQTVLKTGATPSQPVGPAAGITVRPGGQPSAPSRPIGPAAGITFNPSAGPDQNGNGVGSGMAQAARNGISAATTTSPAPAQAGLNQDQRSAAAFAYSQGVDRATGTGPATAPAAGRGIDMGIMAKRFDAYQKDPSALAMANARENMLGSGISMTHGPAGGLTITSNGIGKDALPAAGGSGINMNEANVVLARANATRQSMIDAQSPRGSVGGGSVGVIGGDAGGPGGDFLRAAMTPHPGAPNGQLTANQLNAARGFMADQQQAQLRDAELAQRGAEAGQRAAIEQQRFALEQGAQAARQGIDMARFGMEQKAHESQMEDAGFARLARQGLIDTANSKDPVAVNNARMKAIAAGILKPEAPGSVRDRYLTLTQTDPAGNKTEVALDPVTGRTVRAAPPVPPPQVGSVTDGHRYKGGDPSKRESWEPV